MKEECVIYHTSSAGETVDLGRQLGGFLKKGDVISLAGELGSGKTWFTKGVGLGLAITERIIHNHEGALVLDNREGGGAVVRVFLPLRSG